MPVTTRVAVSGIPSHWVRSLSGRTKDFRPAYAELSPRVSTAGNVKHELRRIQNTGNYLIGEGVRRALQGVDFQHFPFPWLWGADGDAVIGHINASYDVFAFAAANMFHPSFDLSHEVRVFEKLTIPIVILSAGIQNAAHFGETYPPNFAAFMDLLRTRGVKVFTRGHTTATFLKRHGVAFAEPVGCPSLYAFPQNMRRSLRALKGVAGETDQVIVHSGYLGSVKDTVVDVNVLGGGATRAYYVMQDELALFDYKLDVPDAAHVYDETSGRLHETPRFPGEDALTRELHHHVFYNTEQWRAWISRSDFAFARRFHGGIIAAQAGVPSVWLAVDDRTREMLSFMKLPHLEASDWNREARKVERLRAFCDGFDTDAALHHYEASISRFHGKLRDVGLRAGA